jgi:hypothetical protein
MACSAKHQNQAFEREIKCSLPSATVEGWGVSVGDPWLIDMLGGLSWSERASGMQSWPALTAPASCMEGFQRASTTCIGRSVLHLEMGQTRCDVEVCQADMFIHIRYNEAEEYINWLDNCSCL